MNIRNQANSHAYCQISGQLSCRPIARLTTGLAAALLLAGVLAAPAANVTLKKPDASGTSSFTGSTNWNNNAIPSAGNAYFTSTNTLRTTNYVNNGGSIALTFGGDSLSIDTGGRMLGKIGNNGSSGSVTIGTMTANYILNGGQLDEAAGANGNDVLVIAGTVAVNAASFLGASGATSDNSAQYETLEITAPISGSADLQVSGQNVNGGADTGTVKLSAANPYSGTITVPSSRTANAAIANATGRMLQLNNLNAVSNATLNLTTVNINPVSFASAVNTAPFNLGGLSGSSSQTLLDTAGSPVTLSVGGKNASATYSGTLTDGGNLVKVGSGTLTLAGTNTYTGFTTIKEGFLQLGNGGASGALSSSTLITNNANLTINRNNAVTQGADFSSSPITGTGSLTQAGTGVTTLNAANTYSGPTAVNAGKLVVSSTQTGAGAITVADGATLDVSVSGASQLQPSALTLGATAASTLEFDNLSSTSVAPINAGAVTVGGHVTVNLNSGAFAAGNSYPLIHWTGSGPSNTNSFTLGTTPGLTATLSISGSTLMLNVIGVSDIWAGNNGANWDFSTVNWSGHATTFANGDFVLFDDSAPGTTSVIVNQSVQPGGVLFNNSLKSYTIASSGSHNIGGNNGLTKSSSGTVTLSGGANTYTGATIVNNGVLSVGALANGGSASDLGAATSASTNLVLNGGTLQYTGGNASTDRGATIGAAGVVMEIASGGITLTNSGAIVGSGSLTKTGSGTLALAGVSTFSGGVNLSAGELDINNGGSSGGNSAIGTGTLTIGANTIIDNTSGGNVMLLSANPQVWSTAFTYAGSASSLNLGTGPVSMPANCTVMVNGNTLTIGGVISGAGSLDSAGSGMLVLSKANTFSGGVNIDAGTLAVGDDLAVGTGRLNFNGGAFQSADSTAHTFTNAINFGGSAGANTTFSGTGNLKFTGSAANGTAKTTTVNNPVTEFSGVLSGAMARTFSGTGTTVLSGANTYSAGTIISAGATLQLGSGGVTGSLSTSGTIDLEGTLIFNRSNTVVQGVDFAATPITGAGNVVQAGAGTTTLNAANSYSGTTLVNNGGLFITPASLAGGDVTVANGARFGVLASSVSNSATIGNLNLGSGGTTTLEFSYGLTGNPTNAALAANAVTVSGTSVIRISGNFVAGTFPVLKYNSLSGAFAGTAVGSRGVTATVVNDTVNKVINVVVSSTGGAIVWTGTNSVSPNLWDLNTTTNWLFAGSPTVYLESLPPGDPVTFDDSGAGTVLVSNTVSPAKMTVSNAVVNYTFQGSGQINSLGGLTKVGAGTLALNVPAIFSGNTTLSNGAVNFGANQTFGNLSGNSAVAVSSGTPALTVNNSQNTTFAGNVSAAALTKSGSGVLTMTGSNSFSGVVLVNGGAYNLAGGTLNATGEIQIGGTGTGTITQNGGIVIANADVNVANATGATGTYELNGGTLKTLSVISSAGANSTFNFNGGVLMPLADNINFLTNISAVNVRNGGAVIDTSNLNISIYNGLQHSGINGDNAMDGGLTKRGSGSLTLADAYYSSYTGPTVVAGGLLSLYPGSVSSLNDLTVSNGALGLMVTGGSATYNAASLKLAGNAALNLNYDVLSGPPPTTLNVSGGVTVSGVTTINVYGYGWAAGQQVVLVDYTGTPLANLNNFVLGSLPYGVSAYLSNNVANTSIDLVVTGAGIASWIPLIFTDPAGTSSFNSPGLWQDGNAPSAGTGYVTRTYSLRSPADTNAYTFAGSVLSIDVGGRFIMKGTNGQVMTVNNLILNGGLVDYANSADNFSETLGGSITLQGGLTSYMGALGSGGASETLWVTAPIGGSGNVQFSGSPVSNAGTDQGVVILAGTNTYTGTTTVGTGTLLVNGVNGSSPVTVNAGATLGGSGVIGGTISVQAGGTLAPGMTARGALTNGLGTLRSGSAATVSGAVVMKINRDAAPNSDQFAASGVTVNGGATLTVNNLGSTNFAAGDTFTLFSGPVSGTFSAVTLPALPGANLYWTNTLAVNGSIAVMAAVTVNTTPTNVTTVVTGNTLTLTWPEDHKGWHLQVQTNAMGEGLGTNWVTIPGTDAITTTNITINPAGGSVFYRMVYP